MSISFTKMQSAGNDFVVVEDNGIIKDYPAFARFACDRHFGIGSDGVMVITSATDADAGMRMYNPDGSEAEACGNGLRCLVKYCFDKGIARGKTISIATIAGTRQARIIESDIIGTTIEAGMGKPSFDADSIPFDPGESRTEEVVGIKAYLNFNLIIDEYKLSLALVSMGNPHAVCFITQPVSGFPLHRIGPRVEHSAVFPRKTNFEVVRIINRNIVEARVWERGAGETLACGSGACAIGVSAQLLGLVDNPVTVSLPGGKLEVNWNQPGEVQLKGKAVTVFHGELPNTTF
ncbi:MAG: diaminopimelate epimerase [Dehalococcoidales bacterium]|nr:diaminopimelate epimerase [Dehalococcoidales bacterium]MDD3265066.1 diaminopimelate epimerase [Dehalococcoidales bacterium]MDD5122855.1 diaminopimelate epimerase [Dehalococcoidales bacterium]MDD5497949.1 diaminopimelate epimerase [Dehalococcoidales bacterium]